MLPEDDSKPVVPPSEAEYHSLLDACEKFRDVAPLLPEVVELTALTGLRRAEVFNLLWSSVELDRQVIRIESARRGRRVNGQAWRPKNGKWREVPLEPVALDLLQRLRDLVPHGPDDPVFPSRGGAPYARMDRAPEAAGKGYFPDAVAAAGLFGEEVKLLDFGISKVQSGQADDMKLTRTGAVLGTPYYMSPEQAEGAREVDHRTDLWAVGVILYEALTGEVPFRGQTYNQVMLQLMMKDPAPPRDLVPGLPAAAEAVILRALEKDPARRWAAAAELREALRACVPALAPRETPAPSTLAPGLLDGPGSPGPMEGQIGTGAGASLATSKSEMAGASGSLVSLAGPGASSARPVASATDARAPAGEPSALDHTLAPAADLGRQSALRLPSPGRRRLAVVAGAVAALAVVAVILFFALSGGRGDRRPPPAGSSTPSNAAASGAPHADARPGGSVTATPLPMRRAPGAPMQALLSIELAGLPTGATVELDGRRARPPLHLPADGERHVLEVTAHGYHPYTKPFVARAGLRSLTLRPRRRRGSRRVGPRATERPMTRPTTPAMRDRALADPYRQRPRPGRASQPCARAVCSPTPTDERSSSIPTRIPLGTGKNVN